MAIDSLYYLNEVEIDEPIGFAELEFSVSRDDLIHGVSFEASTNTLKFTGVAAAFLRQQKDLYGLKAMVIFQAFSRCDGNYDYELVTKGRLNFGRYQEQCGASSCRVSIPLEEDSCHLTLKSRYDQKVDLDKNKAQDNLTNLPTYAGLNIEMDIPARELLAGTDAEVAEEGHVIDKEFGFSGFRTAVFRPLYAQVNNNSIETGNLDFATDSGASPGTISNPEVISPQLLFEDLITCFDGVFEYNFRMKGSIDITILTAAFTVPSSVKLILFKGEWPATMTMIDSVTLSNVLSQSFDETFTGNTTLAEGEGLYCLLEVKGIGVAANLRFVVTFDNESIVQISAHKICPVTQARTYHVHEALSRVVESITNRCAKVKSEFYGRVDSQPYDFPVDGCGGPRTLTSGLKIRNAENAKFFASLKDLVEGLSKIDNIGMGLESDPDVDGRFLVRIEDVRWFYQDVEILRFEGIPKADRMIEEDKHYSKIEVGYAKWEVERINGLDEINSNREYATSFDTISNTLDLKSKLVTGSYAIEVTRQQSFAETGAADTSYDNEIFLISLFRGGYLYSELMVEQGNILNPANIFSPDTVLNYRLTPFRNLMRWFKTIAAGYTSLGGTDAKVQFNSGSGNIIAEGEQASEFCKIEDTVVRENQNLTPTHFQNEVDFTPIWKPERITFEYPMSLKDYQLVKLNPYGYFSFQCGNGEWEKGWLKEIKYKQVKGMATVSLRKKWQ